MTAAASPGLDGPRRSALSQERSRRTRGALVRAALQLWTARGFERGIEETTAEEIARAAGVTKGTFYFHFARKEDILRELGWGASAALLKDARAAMEEGCPTDEVLETMLRGLARRVDKIDPVAVRRSVAEFYRGTSLGPAEDGHVGFQASFVEVLVYAQARGDVPAPADTAELASVLAAVVLDGILRWCVDRDDDLPSRLVSRAELVLAGAAALARAGH
jgi:AcrR family transcriptional regulator